MELSIAAATARKNRFQGSGSIGLAGGRPRWGNAGQRPVRTADNEGQRRLSRQHRFWASKKAARAAFCLSFFGFAGGKKISSFRSLFYKKFIRDIVAAAEVDNGADCVEAGYDKAAIGGFDDEGHVFSLK